jgi:xanthine dehydrogenase YagR molybdenum-binding subunit
MTSVQRITDHITRLRGDGDAPAVHPRERGDLAPWTAHDELQVVGRVYPRLEGAEKVTGRACYSCDVRLPGQLTVAVLRSPHPHASLVRLDARAAQAMPGVHAVLSSVNAPDIAWHEGKLFGTRLRFAGEEVAAVAAETPEQAADAVRAIDVVYAPLPFVLAAEDAQPGEPQEYRRGDVERGLAAADVVLERVYTTQCALHQCLEPHGCTVSWSGRDLTVWESTQGVYAIRDTLAATLGLPLNRVRVIAEHVGGGFGSKLMAWKHTVIAALLSRSTGRPVQFMLDRSAENLAAGNRNSTRQQVRLGARRDGTLTAIAVDAVAAIGAETVGGEASNIVGIYQRLYRCANVHTRQRAMRVNLGPSCLLEERVVDARSGIVLNANLEDYRVPTVADVPAIVWVGVDHPDPEANVTGAKGIGEPPIIATAAAIANAVHDAIGIRLRDAPLSRKRVLDALRAARRQA